MQNNIARSEWKKYLSGRDAHVMFMAAKERERVHGCGDGILYLPHMTTHSSKFTLKTIVSRVTVCTM